MFLAGVALVSAGCGGSVGGTDRAGKATLAVDHYGCPDLTGTYVVQAPISGSVSFEGSNIDMFAFEGGHWVQVSETHAVAIRRLNPGVFEFRFMVDDARVRQHVAQIRKDEKSRYRELYHLLKDPRRAAYIASNGTDAYARRVLELGPMREVVRELRAGTTAACRDGWLELPRKHADPIRLTLNEDRSILIASRERTTYDVPVWCGDGCKDLRIPTGSDAATLHWARNDAQRPWQVEEMANRFNFEQPIDELEAETRAREEAQQRSDAQYFLSAEEIRSRLEALAPAGTVVDEVEVAQGKVRIVYTAPVAEVGVLLDRVKEAGGSGGSHIPQKVRHMRYSDRHHEGSIEFVLTDSLLVRRLPPRTGQGSTDATASSGKTTQDPAPRMAALFEARPDPATLQPPPGVADPQTILQRTATLFPPGCGVTDVRYEGSRVMLLGRAGQQRCVSAGMRALHDLGSQPELEHIEQSGRDGYTFRVSVVPSEFTRR